MEHKKSSTGWTITGAALGVNLVFGLLYAWSVLKKALVESGWTNTDASLPFTVSAAVFALVMVFAGRAQDKIGPRYIAMLGGLLLGLGMIASRFATTPFLMVITFGLLGGIGIGFGYSATTPCAIKWFDPSKRGLISGIVVSGVGLAPVYGAPLAAYLLNLFRTPQTSSPTLATSGLPETFTVLGIMSIVIVFFFSLFLKNPPESGHLSQAGSSGKTIPAPSNYDWSYLLKTKQFYFLWILYLLTATAGLMLIGHMATIASTQAKWQAGFLLVAILSLFNALGRVFGGILSDKIGRTSAMMLVFAIQAINMFAFTYFTTIPLLIFGAAVAGSAYGALFSLFPATTADFFGVKNLGVNYGLVFTGWGVAAIVGPILGGMVVDRTGSYTSSYITAGILLVIGAVLVKIVKAPEKA